MATLKEEAQAYEAPQTKNISELDKVPTDVEVEDKEFTKEDGDKFSLKVINFNNEDYRVPVSVLKALKAILEEKPDLKFFKVKRDGEGLKTTYTVVTLE